MFFIVLVTFMVTVQTGSNIASVLMLPIHQNVKSIKWKIKICNNTNKAVGTPQHNHIIKWNWKQVERVFKMYWGT